MVRTPSSLRTGAACFIAGWWLGANMKPTPTVSIDRAICSGVRSSFAPSASSTSALPLREDTERLPCLATFAPAAARDERRRGRDVEGVRAVAAGAARRRRRAVGP